MTQFGPLQLRSPQLLPFVPGGLLDQFEFDPTYQLFAHGDADICQGCDNLF
jgi:hypothetical protein